MRARLPERDLGRPRISRTDVSTAPEFLAPVPVPAAEDDSALPRRIKILLDRLIAATAMIALAPMLMLIALAIKLESRGPVVFRQERHGRKMELFTIYKFRTMHVTSEVRGFVQATRGDDRTTRVGRLLRRASLDELPQLYNVLRGDMSLVGPRPHPVDLDARYLGVLPRYAERYSVRPGITGWAQIQGYRGPTEVEGSMEARLESDLYYAENWSIWLDLKIMLVTPFFGIFGKNAF
ncbi:MAG: sugar transferase [Pseudomonadota bacterium]